MIAGGGSEIALAAYRGYTALDEGYQKGGAWGAAKEHLKQSIPIFGMYGMGENLYLAVQKDDPEELGAAALPVFEAAVGMVAGAKLAGVGKTSVYRSRDALGKVNYVGISRSFKARFRAHLREKGLNVEKIDELEYISRTDAQGIEQVLIEHHGLGKNGGTLLNKINSIARDNPAYTQAITRGTEILRDIGYPGF